LPLFTINGWIFLFNYRKNALTIISHSCDIIVNGGKPVSETEVLIFAEKNETAPLLDWMDQLQTKVRDKCLVRIERLKELGHELRRPEADLLRDEIYELRVRYGNVNYRVLYFFHQKYAVLSHGCTKEGSVPATEIDRAIKNKAQFVTDPQSHTYEE
jgi:phage-related protein